MLNIRPTSMACSASWSCSIPKDCDIDFCPTHGFIGETAKLLSQYCICDVSHLKSNSSEDLYYAPINKWCPVHSLQFYSQISLIKNSLIY